MRNFLAIAAMFAGLCCSAQTESPDAVACIGKIVPGARIAKLTASAPGGAQAVVESVEVKKGDYIEAGTVVAVLQGAARAKAALERAEKGLAAAKTASAMRIRQQENLIADLQGSFDQNQRILNQKSPPRREREELEYEQESLARKIAQAAAMLPLVQANEAAVIEAETASLEESKKYYEEFFVRTPISGEVIELNINPGEAVGMDGVCEIADTRTMFVEAEIYVSDISKIKVGDAAEIISDALKGKTHAGKVVQISGYVKSNRMFSADPSDYSNLKVVIAKISIDDSSDFRNLIGSQVNVRILLK